MTATTSTRTYMIDPVHSSVHFAVRHLMISKVRGTFHKISGSVTLPPDSPIPIAVSVTIDATSIDTREPQRDADLKSANFLDVEKFPQLTFKSTNVRATGDATFDLTGDLTIHGTSRSITVKATVEGQGKDPWGNDRIAYESSFKISRKDYGLTYNQALETGGVVVGDEVEINLDLETIPAS